MKFLIPLLLVGVFFVSCSSEKKSAASVAKEWCDLNGKVAKAESDAARATAEANRKKFENEMEEKYKNDEAFLKEVGAEIEKCEDASEGR
jgi:hypothetical protein